MASNKNVDWSDWGSHGRFPPGPWSSTTTLSELPKEILSELSLFKKQERLEIEAQQRRDAFNKQIEEQKAQFERDEELKRENAINTLLHRCWVQGITETRKRAIPAYTFTRFLDLPLEIQLIIWSLAARNHRPHTYPLTMKRTDPHYIGAYRGNPAGSSRIICDDNDKVYSVLHVCQASRLAALEVYSMLPCKQLFRGRHHVKQRFFATLYDRFYMGNRNWYEYTVLVDMMIRRNTSWPLLAGVQVDLDKLQKIKHLIIDFEIFAALPVELWADFRNLESLSIAIWPEEPFYDDRFRKPKRGTKLGKRASWLHRRVLCSFATAKEKQSSDWRIPKIEIIARLAEGEEDDDNLEEDSDRDSSETSNESNGAEYGGQEGDHAVGQDDSAWYAKAEAQIVHSVSEAELRELEQIHHPIQFQFGTPFGI